MNLIDRQAALDILYNFAGCIVDTPNGDYRKAYEASRYKLETLPSADPERKKGRWIDYTDEGYVECPFCYSATNCDDNKDELHFCFSCGADMRGKKDD